MAGRPKTGFYIYLRNVSILVNLEIGWKRVQNAVWAKKRGCFNPRKSGDWLEADG